MNTASENSSSLLVTFQKTNSYVSSSCCNTFPKIPVYSKYFLPGVIMPPGDTVNVRDSNGCHKEQELPASEAEARDLAKYATMPSTAPDYNYPVKNINSADVKKPCNSPIK